MDYLNDTRWKDVIIEGADFPGDTYKQAKVTLNDTVKNEYIPALDRALPNASKGLKLLLIAMTHQEGFSAGTRAYRTNNPGNIGNTDSGTNKLLKTLEDGIRLQASFVLNIAEGKNKNFMLNRPKVIRPFYSKEVALNAKVYKTSPYFPGYRFTYTGELRQFVKVYAVYARKTNAYVNTIVSLFANNGYTITPETTLQQIINL